MVSTLRIFNLIWYVRRNCYVKESDNVVKMISHSGEKRGRERKLESFD